MEAVSGQFNAGERGTLHQDLPYIPLGQYLGDTAYRRGLTDVRRGIVLPLNVRRA